MNKQNKSPKGIKIIAGLMFIVGLWNIVGEVLPGGFLRVSIDNLFGKDLIFIGESMRTVVKEDGSEVTLPWSTKDFLTSVFLSYIRDSFVIMDAIIIGPLLIIASIGLWRIRVWGLLMAMIALGAKFFRDALDLLFYYTGYVKTSIAIEADGGYWWWLVFSFCLLILSLICIVYLWRNRKCFL